MSTLLYLTFGVLAGAAADRLLPRALPYGWLAAALAAVIGSALISLPLQDQGPTLLTVAVIPAAAGALIGAVALRMALTRVVGSGQR